MCSKHSFIKFKCKVKSNMNNTHTHTLTHLHTHTIYTKNTVIYKATLQYAPHSNTYGFIHSRSVWARASAAIIWKCKHTRVSCRLYSKLYCYIGTLYIRNTTSSLCAAPRKTCRLYIYNMPPHRRCLKTKRKKQRILNVSDTHARAPEYIYEEHVT